MQANKRHSVWRLAALAACAAALAACSPGPSPTVYPRIVIDTYKPTGPIGVGVVDNFLTLFGPAGDTTAGFDDAPPSSLAQNDNGNPIFSNYARIDYSGGLTSGTYYIRVRGSDSGQAGYYALRVVTSVDSAIDQDAQYPPAEDWFFPSNEDDSGYETDDDPTSLSSGVPTNPVDISIGEKVNRSLTAGDVDWLRLVLP